MNDDIGEISERSHGAKDVGDRSKKRATLLAF